MANLKINQTNLYTHFNKNRLLVDTAMANNGIPYVFFSTPMLNLTQSNIQSNSFLTYLSNFNPDLLRLLNCGVSTDADMYCTASPFIKILSNTAHNVTTKDTTLRVKEFGETYVGSKIVMAGTNYDSIMSDEVGISFYDTQDLSVLNLIYAWFTYIQEVRKGRINPSDSAISNHFIDYTSSIYYIVTDMDGETIQYWCKYTGVFPTNVPFSPFGTDYSNHSILDYTISFAYSFKEDMDPDILIDFNKVSMGADCSFSLDQRNSSKVLLMDLPANGETNNNVITLKNQSIDAVNMLNFGTSSRFRETLANVNAKVLEEMLKKTDPESVNRNSDVADVFASSESDFPLIYRGKTGNGDGLFKYRFKLRFNNASK